MARFYGIDPHYTEGRTPLDREVSGGVGEIFGGGYMPQPRYEPAYWEQWRGLDASRPEMDWFESRFSTIARRFKATLPTQKGYGAREHAELRTQQIEKEWAEYLKRKMPEIREERASLSFWDRTERPATFAPRIRTTSF